MPPADLVSACEPLPDFTGKDSNSLLNYTVGIAFQYDECSAKQAALSKWSREINQ
jgi:hypothetical protein